MTKSTITRERIQRIVRAIDSEAYDEEEIREWLSSDEIMELARMALAAMDSEPAAYWRKALRADGFCYADGINSKRFHDENPPLPLEDGDYWEIIPLYRHAQPAPVVPVEMNSDKAWGELKISAEDCQAWSEGWNACRAAMLQAKPVTAANKLGNSPVIPDGSEHCPCCGKKLRRACSVEGCGGKHVAHGLCQKHYDMKRWEDPEQVRKFREAGKRYRRKTKSAAAAPQEVK